MSLIDEIRLKAQKAGLHCQESSPRRITRLRTLTQCIEEAESHPPVESIYHNFIAKDDISLVFGEAGAGKTLFGYYLGKKISSRFDSKDGERAKRVLYYDMEMYDSRLLARYPNLLPDPNFFRADIINDLEAESYSFESMMSSLRSDLDAVSTYHDIVLFIDNLKAFSFAPSLSSHYVTIVMNALKELINTYRQGGRSLTVICFAHTDKKTSPFAPLQFNRMAGAKELQTLSDSVIGFIPSAIDPDIRLLKHFKSRSLEQHHLCLALRSAKDEHGNHTFTEEGWVEEREHLATHYNTCNTPSRPSPNAEKKEKAIALAKEGKSLRQIEEEIGIHYSTISRWLSHTNIPTAPIHPQYPPPATPATPNQRFRQFPQPITDHRSPLFPQPQSS